MKILVETILLEIASTKARKMVNSVRNTKILTERDENPSQKKRREKSWPKFDQDS